MSWLARDLRGRTSTTSMPNRSCTTVVPFGSPARPCAKRSQRWLRPKDRLSKNCRYYSGMTGYHQAIRRGILTCCHKHIFQSSICGNEPISIKPIGFSHCRYFTSNCHNHTTIHSQCGDGGTPPGRQTANSKRWQQQKVIIPFIPPWIEEPDCLSRLRIACDNAC